MSTQDNSPLFRNPRWAVVAFQGLVFGLLVLVGNLSLQDGLLITTAIGINLFMLMGF